MTELKIERTGPADDADLRLTITVPWDRMAHKIMKEIRTWGPDGDQVLLGGAIPALAELVGREHPWSLYGPLYNLLNDRREFAERAGQMNMALFVKLGVAELMLGELALAAKKGDRSPKRDAA